MHQQIYWHAPLWEIVIIGVTGFVIAVWLLYRLLKPIDISKALQSAHPVLDEQPLFFYSRTDGLQTLNSSASIMFDRLSPIKKEVLSDILVDVMAETITENRRAEQKNWPQNDQMLTAIPFSNGSTIGALATVMSVTPQNGTGTIVNESDIIVSVDAAIAPVSHPGDWDENDRWLPLGRYLLVHPHQPVVKVRMITEDPDVPTAWAERRLTHLEETLLRHLLHQLNKTQTVESLFQAVWPDDEVDSVGLRPDQKDRLRRLVFQLRQRIEPDPRNPRYLQTAHGVGYTLYERTLLEIES